MKRVYVVGRGNLAQAFLDQTIDADVQMLPWLGTCDPACEGFVYTGSGRELADIIAICAQFKKPLIQGATHLREAPVAKNLDFVWVDAPNLSLPIVKLFSMLERSGFLFTKDQKILWESHQGSKKNTSDTSMRIARSVGLPEGKIVSIRDPRKQEHDLGILPQHLGGHALHHLEIQSAGAKIVIRSEVLGRETYVAGALAVIKVWHQLPFGRHRLVDLVESGRV